jgi:ketosteroid isomerase-like protein
MDIPREAGEVGEYQGVFHTVWKRQPDGTWKYVWD